MEVNISFIIVLGLISTNLDYICTQLVSNGMVIFLFPNPKVSIPCLMYLFIQMVSFSNNNIKTCISLSLFLGPGSELFKKTMENWQVFFHMTEVKSLFDMHNRQFTC